MPVAAEKDTDATVAVARILRRQLPHPLNRRRVLRHLAAGSGASIWILIFLNAEASSALPRARYASLAEPAQVVDPVLVGQIVLHEGLERGMQR